MRFIPSEIVNTAIKETGLICKYSCCNVKNKYCKNDIWEGNLEGFANSLLQLINKYYIENIMYKIDVKPNNHNIIDYINECHNKTIKTTIETPEKILFVFTDDTFLIIEAVYMKFKKSSELYVQNILNKMPEEFQKIIDKKEN